MLKIYGHAKSRAFRVLWLLEELGVAYEHISLDFAKGEHHNPEFLRLNPLGKVPVLVDGDEVVIESSAILLHIMDRYGASSSLAVTEPRHRSQIYQWLFFDSCELEQGLWTAARHSFVLPESKRIPAAIAWGREDFLVQAEFLSSSLGDKEYLVADKFTVVDLLTTQILLWAVQQQKISLPHTNLDSYIRRNTARPRYIGLVEKLRSNKK